MCRSQKFPIDARTGLHTLGTPGCQDCPGPNFPLVSKHWYKLHYPALIDFSLADLFRRRDCMRSGKHKQAHLLISGHDPNVNSCHLQHTHRWTKNQEVLCKTQHHTVNFLTYFSLTRERSQRGPAAGNGHYMTI